MRKMTPQNNGDRSKKMEENPLLQRVIKSIAYKTENMQRNQEHSIKIKIY